MTRCSVVYLPRAIEHLRDLADHVESEASPIVARRFLRALAEYCEGIGVFPRSGQLMVELGSAEIRMRVYRRRTRVVYAVSPGKVEILGIFHGPRDLPKIRRELGI